MFERYLAFPSGEGEEYEAYAASVSFAVRMKCRFFSMPAVAPQM